MVLVGMVVFRFKQNNCASHKKWLSVQGLYYSPVDGSILALTVSCVDHLKLRVLLSGKSTVAGKLLDRIVHRPEEKHHALTAICFLGKIPAHYPSRNIQVDSFRPHGPHLNIANPISPKLGVGGPF